MDGVIVRASATAEAVAFLVSCPQPIGAGNMRPGLNFGPPTALVMFGCIRRAGSGSCLDPGITMTETPPPPHLFASAGTLILVRNLPE